MLMPSKKSKLFLTHFSLIAQLRNKNKVSGFVKTELITLQYVFDICTNFFEQGCGRLLNLFTSRTGSWGSERNIFYLHVNLSSGL